MLGATFLLIAALACSDSVSLSSNVGAFAAQLNLTFVDTMLVCLILHVFLDFLASAITLFIVLAVWEN